MKGDALKFLNNFLPIYARGTLGPDPILFLLCQPFELSLRARPRSIGGGGTVSCRKKGRKMGTGEVTA